MTGITTHVLDTSRGRPAAGVAVRLEHLHAVNYWRPVGRGVTDADGRLRTLLTQAPVPGMYRLAFETAGYFRQQAARAFYPEILITFEVVEGEPHYHVPLLLSPFGYSTYRGT